MSSRILLVGRDASIDALLVGSRLDVQHEDSDASLDHAGEFAAVVLSGEGAAERTRAIRRRWDRHELPVVVIGSEGVREEANAFDAGADAYFSPDDVESLGRDHIQRVVSILAGGGA